MPTLQIYLSDGNYLKLSAAVQDYQREVDDDPNLVGPAMAIVRLVEWFIRRPDSPLRRSAIRP